MLVQVLGCPGRERRRGLVRKHGGPTIADDSLRKPLVTFESLLRTFEKPFRSSKSSKSRVRAPGLEPGPC